MTFLHDVKFAIRSLARTKGLTITVVFTLPEIASVLLIKV